MSYVKGIYCYLLIGLLIIISQTIISIIYKRTIVTEVLADKCLKQDVQFQGEEFQIYVAQGHELNCPVQILEPASLKAVLRTVVTEEEVQEIEFKMPPCLPSISPCPFRMWPS